jgi:hypothetical protein
VQERLQQPLKVRASRRSHSATGFSFAGRDLDPGLTGGGQVADGNSAHSNGF